MSENENLEGIYCLRRSFVQIFVVYDFSGKSCCIEGRYHEENLAQGPKMLRTQILRFWDPGPKLNGHKENIVCTRILHAVKTNRALSYKSAEQKTGPSV